jgi:DNA replication and repair protein RecF
MRFLNVRIQNFRNIDFAALNVASDRVFFCGLNAQGKSNLMEALGLITALRSFRAHEQRVLIRQGAEQAELIFNIEHEHHQEADVRIVLKQNSKEVYLDGEKFKRFSDFVGQFPVVAFSSQDIQLLRGGPSLRRRFLDLMLASMDPEYLVALQQYHHGLQARNQLLKTSTSTSDTLPSFEKMLAGPAALLIQKRIEGISCFSKKVQTAYAFISGGTEDVSVNYLADCALTEKEDLLRFYADQRRRDLFMKSTQRGPHRDDLVLKIHNRPAREYASEGQQRSFVLALRLAQVAYFYEKSRIRPVVLADDILGELDLLRQAGFYAALDPALQVFATGTQSPGLEDEVSWLHFSVHAGVFNLSRNVLCQD